MTLKPKPAGLGAEYGAQFDDRSVVAAYPTRPPYPERLLSLIVELSGKAAPRLLDLGCGTGELTRRLAGRVGSIVAVDRSPHMIAAARTMEHGDAPNIEWVVGAVEEVTLAGPFDCALAAESFHWFEWPATSRRIGALVPSARLVLVEGRVEEPGPWSSDLRALIGEYSTNREFEAYDLVGELVSRDCFELVDRARIGPEPFRQSVDDYIASLHSRNGLSRDRMAPGRAQQFDARVRALIAPHEAAGQVELRVRTDVAWGTAR